MNKYDLVAYIILLFLFITFVTILYIIIKFLHKWIFIKELDLHKRYDGGWVAITGGSSGQGKDLAHLFAERGFNVLIIGSVKSEEVAKELERKYAVKTRVIIKDFCNAMEPDFFKEIQCTFKELDISVLINNIGHRVAGKPYHNMKKKKIKNTIVCGTIVQAEMTRIALQKFIKRNKKCGIIFITAQCLHPNWGLGFSSGNEISVPYLSAYEGANAFGFYHANSIIKEYTGKNIDMLNIMPGAVITENTQYLKDTLFAIDSSTFTKNIVRLLGNINGYTCGYWGHEFSVVLLGLAPFIKDNILQKVGDNICNQLNKKL